MAASIQQPSYGRNSFIPPRPPPVPEPQNLQIAVWVGSKQKLVTGLTRCTTCDDVITALIHQENFNPQEGYTLFEAWGKEERVLRGRTRVTKVLRSWGEDLPYVKFSLRQKESSMEWHKPSAQSSINMPHNAPYPLNHATNPNPAFNQAPKSAPNPAINQTPVPNPAFRGNYVQNSEDNTSKALVMERQKSDSSIKPEDATTREAISRLTEMMREQDRKLEEQLSRISEVEGEIEEYETKMHMSRMEEDGACYIQAGYLFKDSEGSSGGSSGGSSSGDEAVVADVVPDIGAEEYVEAVVDEYTSMYENVSRVEHQLTAELERIQDLSLMIDESSKEHSTTNQGSINQPEEGTNVIQHEVSALKEAMRNSLYVSMSQEEQIYKMNQALEDLHSQLQGKEDHLMNLLSELGDQDSKPTGHPQQLVDNHRVQSDKLVGEVQNGVSGCETGLVGGILGEESIREQFSRLVADNQDSSQVGGLSLHNLTEYSMLRNNPVGGGHGLVNNILLRYKQNLDQIQTAINQDSTNNTSSGSDDSQDSGISGSDPEKAGSDSDTGAAEDNKQSDHSSLPSAIDMSHSTSQHFSQISVICQNTTHTNETLPNDTLQPLDVLVNTETVITSTPVQEHSSIPMRTVIRAQGGGARGQSLLDQVRLNAHLAQAQASNKTDDGKTADMADEEEEELNDTVVSSTAADNPNDTYTMLCVASGKHAQRAREEDEDEDDEEVNNTFKMPLKSPMPARKRVAFAERDSIREITMYSINDTTLMEDDLEAGDTEDEEVDQPSSLMTQDITNSSGDVHCWGMACSSSRSKHKTKQGDQHSLPRLPLPLSSQNSQNRFVATLHPHNMEHQTSKPTASMPAPHHPANPPREKHLENESYRVAVYNFPPANESYNNYLSSGKEQLSVVEKRLEAKQPSRGNMNSKSRLVKLSKEPKEAKKPSFVKKFKMPWHSEKKTNKEIPEPTLDVAEKSLNQTAFHDTFNDSYRHALTVDVGNHSAVNGRPSVRRDTSVERQISVDDSGVKQEAATPSVKLGNSLRNCVSEGHIRRYSAPAIDTDDIEAEPLPPAPKSACTTPKATPTRKQWAGQTPHRSGHGTPMSRSYTTSDIGKIGYSWIYQYEYQSPGGNCSSHDLDTTLIMDTRDNEQCSPGSNSAGYESDDTDTKPSQLPLDGRDMVPYCTYSTFGDGDKTQGHHDDTSSDTGLSSMHSDEPLPVFETLV